MTTKTLSESCKSFMEDVRLQAGGGSSTPPPPPRHEPAQRRTPQPPAPANGGQPPNHPPAQSGGGGGNGPGGWFKEWSRNNRGWALILGLTGMLLAIIVLFVINDFFTERQISRLERLNRILPAPTTAQVVPTVPEPAPQIVRPAPTAQASAKTIELQDGITPILPENAKIVLRGPITKLVIVNTASRIKSFSGDFKLVLESDGTRAWTPGFDKYDQSPNDMADFINRLPKWPEQNRVRIFVQPGHVLELNT